MNKRLIERLIQQRVTGIKSHDGYFFRTDFEHILRGVLLEYVPRGVYVTNFLFPLFDPVGPNLMYSNRTPGSGFMGKGELSEAALVDHVLSVPELHRSLVTDPPMSLEDFMDYLPGLRNEHARLMQAAALILLRQDDGALEVLDTIGAQLHSSEAESYRLLRASLQQRSSDAIEYLECVRRENLRAFGLGRMKSA